ncbi:MAG TPA: hypothetical protein VMW38_07255 [Terriglobia bacterium]|nr:hypothetical protein [Terriglobia bacterium]
MNIENQPITIAASRIISVGSRGHDEYILKLELDADLSDLQQNITGLLRSQLDKDEGSGRLAIVLGGEVTISPQQIQTLKNQLRDRTPAR